jgi:DNA polymerase-3 subunit epsilon
MLAAAPDLRIQERQSLRYGLGHLHLQSAAVLDSETTDLTGFPISLAVVRVDGTVLFDRLMNPEAPISPGAHQIHGLTDADVAEAPTLAALWNEVEPLLRNHHLIAYNATFDQGRIHASALRYGLDGWLPMDDLMQKYADYRHTGWRKLEKAARSEGITPGGQQALGDCLAALGLIRVMAGEALLPEVEEAEPELALEEIPF